MTGKHVCLLCPKFTQLRQLRVVLLSQSGNKAQQASFQVLHGLSWTDADVVNENFINTDIIYDDFVQVFVHLSPNLEIINVQIC